MFNRESTALHIYEHLENGAATVSVNGENQGEIYEHNNELCACFNYNNPGLFEVGFCCV